MTAEVINLANHKPARYYSNACEGLAELITRSGLCVLDVGCASGEAGRFLLDSGKAARAVGIEVEPEQAAIARTKMDEVVCGDVSEMDFPWPEKHFDCVMLGDILEHLIDPWRLLARLKPLLKPDGFLVASIPNVSHLPVVYDLIVRNDWRYREHGVLDATHLRFFTKKTAIRMFDESGYKVEQVSPHLSGLRYRLPSRMTFGLLDNFMAVQWCIRARVRP